MTVCGERVGCFTGLRDGHEQRIFRDDRISVSVFTGDFHRAGNTRQFFQLVPGDQAGMVTGAACNDMDLFHLLQDIVRTDTEYVGKDMIRSDPAFQCFCHRYRLFKNLLLHVVAELPPLNSIGGKISLFHRAICLCVITVVNVVVALVQAHHVALLKVDKTIGNRKQGVDI